MALQSDPTKLPRLNWRKPWEWRWRSRPQTGSETDNKPVESETGSGNVRQPVAHQTGSMPVQEPVSGENLKAWLESISPKVHAQHLLAWLQTNGCGGTLRRAASIRDNHYPKLCAERDWEPLPWHGCRGVGKHLAELCGGRLIRPDPDGRATRCYAIPAAVVELAAAERRRA
jgi:hypothetical protein